MLKKKIEEFKNILFKAKTYIDEAAEVELAIENIEQDIINGTDTKTVEEISRLIAAAELLKAIKVEDVVGWFNSTIANCQTALSELEILGHVPTSEDLENIKANKGEDVALILYGVYPGMDTVELTTAYISAQADYIGWLANSTGLKASASLTVLKSDFENVKEVVSGIEDDLTGLNFTQIRSELEKIASLRLPFQIEQYIFDLIQKIKYKAKLEGVPIIEISPRNTSKTCSKCGYVYKRFKNQRVFHCPKCGLVIDRDLNASINIARKGMKEFNKRALKGEASNPQGV